jgi:hypothetical protein
MPYYRCPECGLTTHSVAGYSTVGECASCAAPLPFGAGLYPAVTLPLADGLRDAATQSALGLEEEVAQ